VTAGDRAVAAVADGGKAALAVDNKCLTKSEIRYHTSYWQNSTAPGRHVGEGELRLFEMFTTTT